MPSLFEQTRTLIQPTPFILHPSTPASLAHHRPPARVMHRLIDPIVLPLDLTFSLTHSLPCIERAWLIVVRQRGGRDEGMNVSGLAPPPSLFQFNSCLPGKSESRGDDLEFPPSSPPEHPKSLYYRGGERRGDHTQCLGEEGQFKERVPGWCACVPSSRLTLAAAPRARPRKRIGSIIRSSRFLFDRPLRAHAQPPRP